MCRAVVCAQLRKDCDELNTCEGFILTALVTVTNVRVIAHVRERGNTVDQENR